MKRLLLATTTALLAGTLTGCGQGQFANPFAVQLEVTLTPSAIELVPGEVKTATVSVKDAGVTLTKFDVSPHAPEGITVQANGPVLSIRAAPGTRPGLYPTAVTASVPGGSGRGLLNVTVKESAAPSYTATLSEDEITVKQGEARTVSVAFTRDVGYTQTPTITRIEEGEALNARVSGNNTVILNTTKDTTPGTYVLTVRTSDGHTERVMNLTVTVEGATQ